MNLKPFLVWNKNLVIVVVFFDNYIYNDKTKKKLFIVSEASYKYLLYISINNDSIFNL
jgi:hypothetical protein